MTTLNTSNKLACINAELEDARQDLALLERLKSAADRVKRLTADQQKALKEHEAAVAAQAKARTDARFKGLSDIRVVDTTPDESVLRSGFAITYNRVTYDMDTRESSPQAVELVGFGSLPDAVFAFLVEQHPDRIPAKIADLAPGDPAGAFRRYFSGLRRGYIAS